MKIDEFLAGRHINFERLSHPPTFTANRMAQVLHVPGRRVAKSVLVRTGQGYALAVLPSTHQVDLTSLKRDLGDETLQLANEDELERVFLDCERGARPPFGSLYDVPTIVDDTLAKDDAFVFEGQNHEESLRIAFRDYEDLEHPRHGHFACRP